MATTVVANSEENDVVFGISFSGETKEVAKILSLAKERGAMTISLTKYGRNLVSQQADINLYTSAMREATFRSAATSSRLAQLRSEERRVGKECRSQLWTVLSRKRIKR